MLLSMRRALATFACLIAFASSRAIAQTAASPDSASDARLDLGAAAKAEVMSSASPRARFTDPGSHWGVIGGGVAHSFDDATDTNVFFQYTYFFDRRVEFLGELGGWYYHQDGDDAWGLNPAMVVRYHYHRTERMTLFIDVGIGLLFASDNVPDGGTSFDFTPRAGTGLTYRLFDDESRLVLGVRWAHVSNARIAGDLDNPGRDGVMLYAGYQFPF